MAEQPIGVHRQFVDHGVVELALPIQTLLATFLVTSLFCILITEACRQKFARGLLVLEDESSVEDAQEKRKIVRKNEGKVLELSVRTTSVVYTGVIYYYSAKSLYYETSVYYPTAASRVYGLGFL